MEQCLDHTVNAMMLMEVSLTETSCFWRIKQNTENDGDMWKDCIFEIGTSRRPMKQRNLTSELPRFHNTNRRDIHVLNGIIRAQFCPEKIFDCIFNINQVGPCFVAVIPHIKVNDSMRSSGESLIYHTCYMSTVFALTIILYEAPSIMITVFLFSLPVKKYQHILTLIFVTEEINKNPNLLPNISVIFTFFPFKCDDSFKIIFYLRWIANTYRKFPNYRCTSVGCGVLLTGPTWAASSKIGTFLTIFDYAQIHYGPFHPILSDRYQYPYLYQIAPKNTRLTFAIVSLMLHFNWTWVGLVISDDDHGIPFLSDLRERMQGNELCLAFVNVIPLSMELYNTRAEMYYKQIVTSLANVVIIYGEMNSTLEVSFRRWAYLGIRRIWVTTSQWDVITTMKRDFIPDSFHEDFSFSNHHHEIPNFKKFIQTINTSTYPIDISLMRSEWMYFNCSDNESKCRSQSMCLPNTSLEWYADQGFDMAMNDENYNLYNAVYAWAYAVHEISFQQVDVQPIIHQHLVDCPKFYRALKNIQFINSAGELVAVNENTKIDVGYDILHILNFPQGIGIKVKIGQFSPYLTLGQQLYLSETKEWVTGSRQIPSSVCSLTCRPGFRKFHQEGKAACCFDCSPCPVNEISNETNVDQCVKCPIDQYANIVQTYCLQKTVTFLSYEDPFGMALAYMALCFSALTALVLGVFVKHQDTPIVKANNRTNSYILLISLEFCFLCSLLFIGHPSTATCILQQITFAVLFTVAVSTILAKTITVVLAFKVTVPGRKMRGLLVSGAPNFIIPICTLIQLVLCGIWLGTSPPFVDTDAHSEHGHIIIVCNKGSVTAFYCVLGYLGSLALGSFTVAFLARNLPDTFNEAKFLTFSMLVFCSVWVTFLPVYHSTKGKAMVMVEVFSILASSAGLLGCIFFPKCYIILLRPSRNSLQSINKKHTVQPTDF
uniref:vomeronasal type-2 receptor 116-like n=1 Tax=Jaculus jaculus TaxID=51337 RepID=UPI001E1B3815|nr:vomeronasal type-2 receptor 116-like [Jaculus jaculus]